MHSRDDHRQLWRGTWIDAREYGRRQSELGHQLSVDLARPLDLERLLFAADNLGQRLRQGTRPEFQQALSDEGLSPAAAEEALVTLGTLLRRDALEARLLRELGSTRPAEVTRFDLRRPLFEGWAPLGVLVHVAPEDNPLAAPLSMVEGLLTGNINLLEATARGGGFARALVAALLEEDATGSLAPFVYAFRCPDARNASLTALLSQADGVVAWGEETALRPLRERMPSAARLMVRSPRLGLAYIAPSRFDDVGTLERLAGTLRRPGVLAATGPACCLLDTEDAAVLTDFGRRLESVLSRGGADAWEVQVETALGVHPALEARTVRVMPLPRHQLVRRLRPLRGSLGTASLACGLDELGELSTLLLQAGISRLVEPGHAHETYVGEPRDGGYPLQEYSRRVSARPGAPAAALASLAELAPVTPVLLRAGVPVLTKDGFQKQEFDEEVAQVFFKSGGSSAAPTLSAFSYRDYEEQMRAMAEGLLATGVEPGKDRCMNLFFAGNLYGSFLSFFSILEHLGAVQFPMVALPDLELVAQTILRYRVNALFGMSSYLVQLMRAKADLFKADPVVKKLFYAGEHMGKTQAEHLRREFGIEVIRSASYGSNDAGPLGFACPHSEGGVHHLLAASQYLEILRMDEDRPVEGTEVGRLIFTSRLRRAQRVERYEIGDLGRWVPDACPCGRKQPRFELMGRFGDVFRAAGLFFNHRKFAHILEDRLGYVGMIQIRLAYRGLREVITLRLEEGSPVTAPEVLASLGRDDESVKHSIQTLGVADLEVEFVPLAAFVHSTHSGKLRPILDERSR